MGNPVLHRHAGSAPEGVNLRDGGVSKESRKVCIAGFVRHWRRYDENCIASEIRKGENCFGVSGCEMRLERGGIRCETRQRCALDEDKVE